MKLTIGGHTYQVEMTADGVTVDGQPFAVNVDGFGGTRITTVNGRAIRVDVAPPADEGTTPVTVEGKTYQIQLEGSARVRPSTPRPATAGGSAGSAQTYVKGAVTAQMTGRVVRVAVDVGQAILNGDLLLILEAMKMENEVRCPRAGTIKEVRVAAGDRVNQGDPLVVLDE